MVIGDFAAHGQKRFGPGPELRHPQGIAADQGVGFHHLELVERELSGFEEHPVGDADLANIVQRAGLEQALDERLIHHRGMFPVFPQSERDFPGV